jgi:hypothetical protein
LRGWKQNFKDKNVNNEEEETEETGVKRAVRSSTLVNYYDGGSENLLL